ncbi:hypothetical protein MRX96_028146 [Rhipicephalus microplus]
MAARPATMKMDGFAERQLRGPPCLRMSVGCASFVARCLRAMSSLGKRTGRAGGGERRKSRRDSRLASQGSVVCGGAANSSHRGPLLFVPGVPWYYYTSWLVLWEVFVSAPEHREKGSWRGVFPVKSAHVFCGRARAADRGPVMNGRRAPGGQRVERRCWRGRRLPR